MRCTPLTTCRQVNTLLLVMACECTLPSARAASTLLRNGGFEEVDPATNVPKHWHIADWSPEAARGRVAVAAVASGVVEGRKAVRIVYEGKGANVVIWQDVPRQGKASYVLKLQCNPPNGKWASASAVSFAGNTILRYENSKRCEGNGQWQALELCFETPPETGRIRIILRTDGNTALDCVALTSTDEPAGAGPGFDVKQEPSDGKELEAKRSAAAAAAAAAEAGRAGKSRMSPEELAWEEVLEASLGSFYLPLYKKAKASARETAWDYVKDDPALPRVLLIGDSISRGYTLNVRHALKGKVNVHRAPANCGPTTMGLKQLDLWLGDGKWDLIHFNFGIHDRNSKPAEYAERLEQIVLKLKPTGAKLVWVSSTPLAGGADSKFKEGVIERLNEVAAELMQKHGIPTDDLYSVARPVQSDIQTSDGCHFNAEGYVLLGQTVADCLLQHLGLD